MIVDPTIPASSTDGPGRHRIQRGIRMPGFGRILATRDEHTVETILSRHGRRVLSSDELEKDR